MFTFPAGTGGGIILAARPSASSGTITNPTYAYDLPGGLDDDFPYSTSADRATVTGSATPGTVDHDTVEYNTFPSRGKSNFSVCNLVVVTSVLLQPTVLTRQIGGVTTRYTFVVPDLSIDYQINGSTWVNLKNFYCDFGFDTGGSMGAAADSVSIDYDIGAGPEGTVIPFTWTKYKSYVSIPSSSFPSNLNSLKVRFRLGTCTNSVNTSYKSAGSYNVWDIRANIS